MFSREVIDLAIGAFFIKDLVWDNLNGTEHELVVVFSQDSGTVFAEEYFFLSVEKRFDTGESANGLKLVRHVRQFNSNNYSGKLRH